MRSSILLPRRTLAVWLPAFFSPTLYFLFLLVCDRLRLVPPPEALVASLFFGIPIFALLVCETAVWRSELTGARRVGWMLLTLFGILLQFGGLLVIISAITAAIALP